MERSAQVPGAPLRCVYGFAEVPPSGLSFGLDHVWPMSRPSRASASIQLVPNWSPQMVQRAGSDWLSTAIGPQLHPVHSDVRTGAQRRYQQ